MAGLVDRMEAEGFRTFGPRSDAAILEGSKVFSKFDGLTVHKGQYGNLPPCHKFLNNHTVAGVAEMLIRHDLPDACLRFLKRFADQHALAQGKTVFFTQSFLY